MAGTLAYPQLEVAPSKELRGFFPLHSRNSKPSISTATSLIRIGDSFSSLPLKGWLVFLKLWTNQSLSSSHAMRNSLSPDEMLFLPPLGSPPIPPSIEVLVKGMIDLDMEMLPHRPRANSEYRPVLISSSGGCTMGFPNSPSFGIAPVILFQ